MKTVFTIFVLLLCLTLGQSAFSANFQKGRAAYKNGDFGTALSEFTALAEQGHAGAQRWLAHIYNRGHGVSKDQQEANKWYHRAAEQGDAESQSQLGLSYLGGHGVPKDPAKAVKWFRRSAEQGYALGQVHLGIMYASGSGVTKDSVYAYMWFHIASSIGLKVGEPLRDEIARRELTQSQLEEAQRLVKECVAKNYTGC